MNQKMIFDTIIQHVQDIIPALQGHDFQHSDSLRALGANSVDRADILMMTLESLSLNIPLMELAKAESIGDLARIIYEKS